MQAWDIVEKTWEKIFTPPFPIYDEAYRSILAKKILMHYYMEEIGLETPAYWQLKLNIRMNEIMPYYNKLYQAYALEFNPLYDVDYRTTREGEKNDTKNETGNTTTHDSNVSHSQDTGQTSDTSNTTSQTRDSITHTTGTKSQTREDSNYDDWIYENDTPQGGLEGILARKYLTKATNNTHTGNTSGTGSVDVTENGSDTSNGTVEVAGSGTSAMTRDGTDTRDGTSQNKLTGSYNSTEEYVDHVIGKTGGKSYAAMLEEYREKMVNIDMMIIKDLSDLFMGLW